MRENIVHDCKQCASCCILTLATGGWMYDFLKQTPETNIGYHLVHLDLKNGGRLSNLMVENCRDVEIPEHHKDLAEVDIAAVTVIYDDGTDCACRCDENSATHR